MLAFVFFKVNMKSEIDPIFLVSGVIEHVITKNTLVAICNYFTFGEFPAALYVFAHTYVFI